MILKPTNRKNFQFQRFSHQVWILQLLINWTILKTNGARHTLCNFFKKPQNALEIVCQECT